MGKRGYKPRLRDAVTNRVHGVSGCVHLIMKEREKDDENELSMYRHPRLGDILLRMRKDGELSRGFGAALRLR